MANNTEAIQRLERLLNSGQTETFTDGLRTKFDLEQVRRRIAELRAEDDASIAAKKVRPRVFGLKLGGAW